MRSLPVAALVVLFTVLLGAPAALAHTSLQKSTPAAGVAVARPARQ
jgi:methionine-rich copper-binding protein CopC